MKCAMVTCGVVPEKTPFWFTPEDDVDDRARECNEIDFFGGDVLLPLMMMMMTAQGNVVGCGAG